MEASSLFVCLIFLLKCGASEEATNGTSAATNDTTLSTTSTEYTTDAISTHNTTTENQINSTQTSILATSNTTTMNSTTTENTTTMNSTTTENTTTTSNLTTTGLQEADGAVFTPQIVGIIVGSACGLLVVLVIITILCINLRSGKQKGKATKSEIKTETTMVALENGLLSDGKKVYTDLNKETNLQREDSKENLSSDQETKTLLKNGDPKQMPVIKTVSEGTKPVGSSPNYQDIDEEMFLKNRQDSKKSEQSHKETDEPSPALPTACPSNYDNVDGENFTINKSSEKYVSTAKSEGSIEETKGKSNAANNCSTFKVNHSPSNYDDIDGESFLNNENDNGKSIKEQDDKKEQYVNRDEDAVTAAFKPNSYAYTDVDKSMLLKNRLKSQKAEGKHPPKEEKPTSEPENAGRKVTPSKPKIPGKEQILSKLKVSGKKEVPTNSEISGQEKNPTNSEISEEAKTQSKPTMPGKEQILSISEVSEKEKIPSTVEISKKEGNANSILKKPPIKSKKPSRKNDDKNGHVYAESTKRKHPVSMNTEAMKHMLDECEKYLEDFLNEEQSDVEADGENEYADGFSVEKHDEKENNFYAYADVPLLNEKENQTTDQPEKEDHYEVTEFDSSENGEKKLIHGSSMHSLKDDDDDDIYDNKDVEDSKSKKSANDDDDDDTYDNASSSRAENPDSNIYDSTKESDYDYTEHESDKRKFKIVSRDDNYDHCLLPSDREDYDQVELKNGND